jgi:PAS domain S-box-containing protein
MASVLDWQGKPALQSTFVDISEGVRAQQLLRESEERYSLAMDGANEGVWDWHIESDSLFVSANLWRYLGMPTLDETLGRAEWGKRIHPDDKEHMRASLIAHLRGEQDYFHCEHRVRIKDDSYRWFHVHGLASRHDDGRAYRLTGSIHDITSRKASEQELSERLRFEALLTRVSAEFIALPPSEIDAAIERSLGTIGEFLGVDRGWVLQTDNDRRRLEYTHEWCAQGIASERSNKETATYPADRFPWYWPRLLRGTPLVVSSLDDFPPEADAERRFELEHGVHSFASVPMDVGGDAVGRLRFECIGRRFSWSDAVVNQLNLLGQMFTNALVRKRTDTALRESEERFRNLVEGSLHGIAIVDTEFVPLFVNNAYAVMFGYANFQDMQPLDSHLSLFSPGERERLLAYGEARLRGDPIPVSYELDGTRKDGKVMHLVNTMRLIAWKGRPAFQITATDISERKRTEERLQDYQQQLRRLASEISLAEEKERRRIASELHDGAIQNMALAKIKLGEFEKGLEPNRRGATLDEIRELLELSIHDARSLIFQLSPPVLYELGLGAAIEWLGEQFQARYGITCRIAAAQDEAPLDVDIEVILFQVLRELLVNVVKHANATRVDISFHRTGDRLSLQVCDDGDGFDAAAVVTGSGSGGFGLFNIRERLQLLGATFEIESGTGTCITVTAPLAAGPQQEAP